MVPYRKFSDPPTPKPPKAPKADEPHRIEAAALGNLGALDAPCGEYPHPQADIWTDDQDERAAMVEHDGSTPHEWAEALARLDPAHPPADVPPLRWLQFINDCGRFLDGGGAQRAAALGWGPLDLFGCDRERPFAHIDHLGLLWLLNGGTVVELHRDRAVLETERGARQNYRRRPVEVGRIVLAWELANCPR
jgi:hypothetical protein